MSDPVGKAGRACSKTEVSKDDELKTTRGAKPKPDLAGSDTPMSGA